jgi:hypothetical protein
MVELKQSSSRRSTWTIEELTLAHCASGHWGLAVSREKWSRLLCNLNITVIHSYSKFYLRACCQISLHYHLPFSTHSILSLLYLPGRIPELSSRTCSVSHSPSTKQHEFLCYPVCTWPSPGWTSHVCVVFSCGALITKQSFLNMLRNLLLLAS